MNTKPGISVERAWKEKLRLEWEAYRSERNAEMIAVEEAILKRERNRVYTVQDEHGRRGKPGPKLRLIKNETEVELEAADDLD